MVLEIPFDFFLFLFKKPFLGNLQNSEPWEGDWEGGDAVGCKEGTHIKSY